MAAPSVPRTPAVETHRLRRDLRQAVYGISGIIFLPLALLLTLRLFDPSERNGSPKAELGFLAVWAIGTMLALLRVRLARLEILSDSFRYVSLFRDVRFRYEDIGGYRAEVGRWGGRSREAIGILYDVAGRRRLRISAYLDRPQSVRDWMRAHFRDLDPEDAAEEKDTLSRLSESTPGILSRLRIAANVLDLSAIALAFLLVTSSTVGGFGRAGKVLAFLVFAVPLIALALRAGFGRAVSFERTVYRSRSARMESVLIVPLIAGWAVAFVVPPVRSRDAWSLALVAGLLFFFAAWRLARRLFDNRFMEAFLLVTSLGYGYGLVCFLNATFDHGGVEHQAVVVRSRSIRRGSATVVVSPRSAPDEKHSLRVPRFLEEALPPGSSAVLLVRPGALGIPWIAGVAAAP